MKKVYLLGTILAATVAHGALADAPGTAVGVPAPQAGCPKAFQGFHLGGNVGYGIGSGKAKFNRSAENTAGNFTTERSVRNDLGIRGFDGGVGVGYTHRFCNWALGLAFDANWASSKGKHSETLRNENSIAHKARLRNSLQLYARAGYVLREIAMPFVGLGWDNSQWKKTASLNVVRNAETDEDGNPNAFTRSASKSKRINAFMWKAGVDFLATKHVVVGFEYTGTAGGKKSFSKAYTNPQSTLKEKISGSFKPQYNKFALTAKIVY